MNRNSLKFSLSEQWDFEYQWFKDQAQPEHDIQKRDRSIGEKINLKGSAREILRQWLESVEAAKIGGPVSRYLALAEYGLLTMMLVLGLLISSGFLYYSDGNPINVSQYFGIIIGVQIIFLFVLLGSVLLGKPPQMVLDALLYPLRTKSFFQILIRYRTYFWWSVWTMLQKMGVVFNVGVGAALLFWVTFTDLSFAWGTTLDIGPEFYYRTVKTLSFPWSFIEFGVPTMDLVASTQYFRIDSQYTSPDGISRSGEWWKFLFMSVVFYGLLPRLFLSAYFFRKKQKSLSNYDEPRIHYGELLRRLNDAGESSHSAPSAGLPDFIAANVGVIGWRDFPLDRNTISAQLKLDPSLIWFAGGRHGDFEGTEVTKAIVESQTENILILIEAWDPPTAGIKRFVQHVLEKVKGKVYLAPVSVKEGLLKKADKDQMDVWRKHGVISARAIVVGV